ncbi:hypothetical protein GCM10025789_06640 [Tessaracoccus lubricantis]|uniref:Glycosyl transferase family 1 domain-containing protein n=1 Tax=Tessaracoccus lubricantis TaxID=545543 RepID=A0ABP9F441_9ACTN
MLLEEAAERHISVVFATSEEVVSDARFAKHIAPVLREAEVRLIQSQLSVRALQRIARDASCDLVVVPDALKYGVRMQIGMASSWPFVRLVMMNDPRWQPAEFSSRFALNLAKRVVMRMSDMRPGVGLLWLRAQGELPSSRTVIDPLVLDGEVGELLAAGRAMRLRLEMPGSVFWFGVVGSLDARKNIPLVVRALSAASRLTTQRVALALLGPWADNQIRTEVEAALQETGLEHVSMNEHLTNREMNVMLAAVDCVVMAYSTHAPNSTAVKAAALGVRTVVAGSVTFRRFNQQAGGSAGVSLDHEALSLELARALSRPCPPPVQLIGPEGLTDPCLNRIHSTRPAWL